MANSLAGAFAAKPLADKDCSRLLSDLAAVLNPAKIQPAQMQAIYADIQAIFQANGMARKDAVKMVDQVKAVAAETQKSGRLRNSASQVATGRVGSPVVAMPFGKIRSSRPVRLHGRIMCEVCAKSMKRRPWHQKRSASPRLPGWGFCVRSMCTDLILQNTTY